LAGLGVLILFGRSFTWFSESLDICEAPWTASCELGGCNDGVEVLKSRGLVKRALKRVTCVLLTSNVGFQPYVSQYHSINSQATKISSHFESDYLLFRHIFFLQFIRFSF